jgi:hypothetical protein
MQTIKNVAFTEGRNRSQDFRLTPGVMQVSAAKRLKNSAQGEAERAIDRDKPPPNGRARIYSSRASRKPPRFKPIVLDLLGFCGEEGIRFPLVILFNRSDSETSAFLEHEQEHEHEHE